MITPADPLPGDLETAHQLIRELLETLGQQIHLNEKLPSAHALVREFREIAQNRKRLSGAIEARGR